MYDELIKRLRNCTSDTVEDCAGCPYQGGYKGTYCMNGLVTDAADAIEDLRKVANKLLAKYQEEATSVIWERSGNIEESLDLLNEEVRTLIAQIDGMPLPQPPKEET